MLHSVCKAIKTMSSLLALAMPFGCSHSSVDSATSTGSKAGNVATSAAGRGGAGVGLGGASTLVSGGALATSGSGGSLSTPALVNPAPGSKAFIGANFWRIDWEGPNDFFLSSVDWATTTNPWQPQLLTDLAPLTVLRFMDWNLTNDDPNVQAVWATRKRPTQAQTAEPVAFEWQIDLCNRALKDCWIAVPIQADVTYQSNLARLIFERLDPKLRLYLEYSNEVWNGSFPQSAIALAQANRLGLLAEANPCCELDTIKTGNAYVYGAVRLFEQFESVFGKNSPRLVKVLAGQAGWDGPCQVHMLALKNTTLNPNGTMPTVYAVAPYFGGTSIAALQNDIAGAVNGVKSHVTCAAKLNLPLVAYEGGSDSYAAGNACVSLQHDAGMYELYKQYYDALVAAGMTGPIMQYTHVGSCWGLKEKTSDTSANSPKYRAVTDWVAAHP